VTDVDSILALIDSAIGDDTVGPDAMRSGGEAAAQPVRPYFQAALVANFDAFAEMLRGFTVTCQQLGVNIGAAWSATINNSEMGAYEHRLRMSITKAYRIRMYQLGHSDVPCACHPAPNAAARDYRRRTKHRSRRRAG
jgi:hypothetical protein